MPHPVRRSDRRFAILQESTDGIDVHAAYTGISGLNSTFGAAVVQ